MNLDPWMVWVAIGVLCMIVEIFTPTFLFLSFGIGAIITGIFSSFIGSTVLQIAFFTIVTFLLFLRMRRLSNKLQSKDYHETNIYALKDKKAIVVIPIKTGRKGYVKVGGEEWPAIAKDGKEIKKGCSVKVDSIEGNTLLVETIRGE
jgi:membrane protein implicated in regulation of membrane protease activity